MRESVGVEPVMAGARLASFFWTQSMIRDDGQRALLLNLDSNIQQLAARVGQHCAPLLPGRVRCRD